MIGSGLVVAAFLLGLPGLLGPAGPQDTADKPDSPPAVSREQAREKVEGVLRALDEKQKGLKDLEAEFVQTQVIHLLKEPDVSRGLLYWKEGKLRMDWTEPSRSILVLDEKGILLHVPEEKRAERFPAGENENFGALFPGFGQTSDEMKKTYEIELMTGPKDSKTWHLRFRPRRKKMRRWVGRIGLWVDRAKGVPIRLRLVDPNGKDYTELVLSKTKVNQGIKKERFMLDLPEGTRVSTPPGGLPF